MEHWIIAPVALPAIIAPLIGFVMRHDITVARAFSVAGNILLVAIAAGLVGLAGNGDVYVYRLGDWPAPFGIVLVLDRLSATMVLLTTVLALIVLMHAIASGWDKRGRHFHALWQFQLMGICGAFLTGDAFNLFVFFEVLLIASYGLMVHSGGRVRMQAGLQYLVMNLAGSTLFLIALGTLYATTGTLNIADLSLKVQQMNPDDAALLRVAAVLLLLVFAIKAAIVPVHFWLPATYANAPAPVAALFAIMTKVGAYAIIRIHTIVFGPGTPATEGLISSVLFPAALITIAVGAIGVLGARRLMSLLAYSVIGSMGTLMLAISVFEPHAMTAALYYIIHSTFAAAALFIIADLVVSRRGNDILRPQPKTLQNGLFAALFFGGAIAMAGMPPLSGFLGKLLILDALRGPWMAAAWIAVLVGSLITILGFARAGSTLFWKCEQVTPEEGTEPIDSTPPPPEASFIEWAPAGLAILALAALTIFAGPAVRYAEGGATELFNPASYIGAVLDPEAKTKVFGKDKKDDSHAKPAKDHGEDH
ncbi:monovalent cation/H+ antiporter subunit D [Pacificoceanicola onchidii]|uniref:monovalent cation/H+ antiporter subunit D n=1 Tax=Pacificoceanicola onchidii TaxID=2562685 RepID=UPI0010A5E0E8|nr:monovalent cation/H+ antiporter subunit D [Pacificoceanicola onchidii]